MQRSLLQEIFPSRQLEAQAWSWFVGSQFAPLWRANIALQSLHDLLSDVPHSLLIGRKEEEPHGRRIRRR